jgi:hypothetical protein
MRGTVCLRSTVAEFVVIETERGDYAVVELFGSELEVGETVVGALDSVGSTVLRRQRDAAQIDALVQDTGTTLAAAKEYLRGLE